MIVLGLVGYFIYNGERAGTSEQICVALTCYSEKADVEIAIKSIAKQDYPSVLITLLCIIDGGSKYNHETVESCHQMQEKYKHIKIIVIDKDDRYGRVHSNNLAIDYCEKNLIPYMIVLDGDTSISRNSIKSFMAMKEPYDGISGNIMVRNLTTIVTKLTYLEYAFGIVLSRLSFSQFGYTNNLSGAFSFWKVSSLVKLNGYRPNSGEDFDATLRAYLHKFKLGHCNEAIAYTDSPPTLRGLLKQRLTWDGDLVFIVGLYRNYLTIKNLGFVVWFFIWYNWLLAVGLPLCLLPYTLFLLSLQFEFMLATLLLVYVIYMGLAAIQLVLCKTLLIESTEQQHNVLEFALYLPIMPFYSLLLRINSMVAYFLEWFFKWHLTSKMAPRYVLLKAHLEPSKNYLKHLDK